MKKIQSCNLALLFICGLFVQTSIAQDYTRWSLPEEAKTRLGEGSITDIAYSPDGAWIAVASSDIWLYDTHTGAEIVLHAENTDDGVFSVAFSPDGHTLASGNGSWGTIWGDFTVRLWDVRTGQLQATLKGHGSTVYSVAFSPDGHTLAGGSTDGTIRLWDVETRQQIATLKWDNFSLVLAFSPDGYTLVSGDELWDVRTEQLQATLEGYAIYVAFSPDGKTLASAGGYYIRLWDFETRQQIATIDFEGYSVFSVAFSPDGHTLASGGENGSVRLWDGGSGQPLAILEGHTDGNVYSVAFSPNGHILASGSYDDAVRLWDVSTGKLIAVLEDHTSDIYSTYPIAFSPDGKTLASPSQDGTILLWDMSPYITSPTSTPTHIAEVSSQHVPTTSGLDPNFPNPFNASTQIAYHLASPGPVRLEIYNVLGQPVRTLVNQSQPAGFYQVRWDARDQRGAPLAAGVYLTRLRHPDGAQTRRLLYLK